MTNKHILILKPNGDIEIWNQQDVELVYHKSFSLGDNLKGNLLIAYGKWERLEEGK